MPNIIEPANIFSEKAGLVGGHREAYVGTSSTAVAQARASLWADRGSGGQCSLKSSNNQDGAAGNQGALSVRVTYYRGDGSGPYTENVNLNGTSGVNMVETSLRFVENIEVLTVGTNGANMGNVDVMSSTGGAGSVLGRINTGENRTLWALHWVPPGVTMHLLSVRCGIQGGTVGRVMGRFQNLFDSAAANVDKFFGLRVAGNQNGVEHAFATPVRLSGPGLFVLWVRADDSTASTWFPGFTFFDQ